MKHCYKSFVGCLLGLATASFSNAQTVLNFESETVGDFVEVPSVTQATMSRSGVYFTAISSVAAGIYYGFERDIPSNYPLAIGYNSTYFYMGTLNGDPLTEIDITMPGGALFNFDKIRLSPYPSDVTYDVPFDVYVQGFKGGSAVTSKLSGSTIVHGNGGWANVVDFDLTGDATFKGVDKVVITTSITNDYTALDNVELTPVTVTPVTVTGFSGTLTGNTASFNWASGVEANFSRYILEKSLDGKMFTVVREIAGQGSGQTYKTSVIQQADRAYYRLKLVDRSEQFSYYEHLLTLDKKSKQLMRLYPSPATDYIKVIAPVAGVFVIYDASGKRVFSKDLKAGETRLNISMLASGSYYGTYMGHKISFVKN